MTRRRQLNNGGNKLPMSVRKSICLRRQFLKGTGAALLAGPFGLDAPNILRAQQQAKENVGDLRVTEIESHPITLEYHDWLAYPFNHFYGPSKRTVYVVHTNRGLIGLGESGSPESAEIIKKYQGTNPFDWVGDETSLGLGTAMYDLMGQAAGVPVYKLFGQRYRRWVPVGAWTVSTHPKRMAEAVQKYAARGYRWLKFHLSPFENIIDQFRAMQAVAPAGFKIHLDFTMHGTNDHVIELLQKISRFSIAGCFEDPLFEKDIEGYAELRKRISLPVVLHHSPLGATFEVLRQAADAYILGHAKIGTAMRRSGLFAAANLPFMLQNVGGHITRTMTTHMQAAFKTAHFHFQCDAESWKSDVVKERQEPTNGFLRVSEKPGLGVTLDRAELERLKALKLPEQAKWIIKTRFKNGTLMYNIADTKDSLFMVRPDKRRLIPMSYDAPLTTEYWDDDGTAAYREMFKRIEREGVVLVKPK